MELNDIQRVLPGAEVFNEAAELHVRGIEYRSQSVRPGDLFFCIPGFRHDGHSFAEDAVERGATALVVERRLDDVAVPQFKVSDARVALSAIAAEFWGTPSRELEIVGITGTNGKTTTSYLCDSILRAAGRGTGIVGTVETRILDERSSAGRTTPESADLQKLLAQMVDAGVRSVSIEVSSHAIDLHRVDDVRFAVAAFTNLTQDHLDYHHTLEEYFGVKKRLFTELDVDSRVVNIDDELGAGLALELDDVITVGMSETAQVRAEHIDMHGEGSRFDLVIDDTRQRVELPLAGAYNISNALVAAGCGHALRLDIDVIVEGLAKAPQVPGRLERVGEEQGFGVFVDYAHTPDSLEKAIAAVRDVTDGRVIVVFGAGGDRDPDKRPLMGAAAGRFADHSIITSDNPRSEDPVGIILQVEDGLRGLDASYEIEVDRRAAIAKAIAQAAHGDAVLIAGKGHEDYQQFRDRTVHFDDREVAREELAGRC